jgi:hypothetical protein
MSSMNFNIEYQVTSVEKTENPLNGKGENWYEYVISNAGSTITGQRQGTLKQVTQHAKDYCRQLNERMNSGASYYSARKKPVEAKSG